MRRKRVLAITAILLALLTIAFGVLMEGWTWYQGLMLPRSVKAQMGTTAWTPPSGAVPDSLLESSDPSMTRAQAAILLHNPEAATGESVRKGKEVFGTYCLPCHGPGGRGDGPIASKLALRLPDLPAVLGKSTDGYLYATIRDGGVVMPPQGYRIPGKERWDVVNFLRSIQENVPANEKAESSTSILPSPKAESRAKTEVQGDPARGRAVFEANCQLCHYADSEETNIGPGLKGLFHWPPHKLSDGTEHKEHTVAIIRKQITEGGGAMEPVGASFSEQEIDDLIAYLQTL